MNGHFVYYQPNEKDTRNKVGDCTIRALTKFLNISWLDAFELLCEGSRASGCMPNEIKNVKAVMRLQGYKYHNIGNMPGTVDEFVTENKNKYMLFVKPRRGSLHMVTCRNHYYYDTWDSGRAKIIGYWEKTIA